MDPLPLMGRLAGMNYGSVRFGIAITDPAQSLSSPLEILTRRDKFQDERYFRRLAEQERLAGFVGLERPVPLSSPLLPIRRDRLHVGALHEAVPADRKRRSDSPYKRR